MNNYAMLLAGVGLLILCGWLLTKNIKRSGFINFLFRIDLILGIAAGVYLMVTSATTLWL